MNLPYMEAAFERDLFLQNPLPFFVAAKKLWPGQRRPTLTHAFIKLLDSKNLLHTSFTQNIDMLERAAGVPPSKLVEAHGSYAAHSCIECAAPYDGAKMEEAVMSLAIPRCEACGGLAKSDVVLYGDPMPPAFFSSLPRILHSDLLIVMGTSLAARPFADLAELVRGDCPRVLLNKDAVGEFERPDDVVRLGECDQLVRVLCRELGWEGELEEAWEAVGGRVDRGGVIGVGAGGSDDEGGKLFDGELENITRGIDSMHGLGQACPA
ncbi:hypothetical protein SERLA73DRAFT_116586 [Serpula lacrymans var. lacrymans S7.3]|uniref:Deacetylase sirtuin-type domain-containing protein n=2 Tax=Serpula lacrymans var. lacrymans TaxID=341189 RepID=F8QFG1_SERL3|nr:hypothetical protein SERLA73DRAFT_116586 [Serpula lacrymans var. lacrymans S7.3]